LRCSGRTHFSASNGITLPGMFIKAIYSHPDRRNK
jgi:hypothetical protein